MDERLKIELDGLENQINRLCGDKAPSMADVIVRAKAMLEHLDWTRRAARREDTPGEDSYKITDELAKTMISLASSFWKDLLEKSGPEIAAEWSFKWDETRNIEQNIYEFSDILELHKRRWNKWEEHHNGPVLAVERVRDKYVMPRIREFLALLADKKMHITSL